MSVYSIRSMFWTNKKLSLMVASVSISCFKVQSSIGHLVCFFDNGNSVVSGELLVSLVNNSHNLSYFVHKLCVPENAKFFRKK